MEFNELYEKYEFPSPFGVVSFLIYEFEKCFEREVIKKFPSPFGAMSFLIYCKNCWANANSKQRFRLLSELCLFL